MLLGSTLQTIPARGSLALIYAGRTIAGFGIGGVSSIAPGYVAECAPANARGRITGLFQIIVALGVMLSYFANYGVAAHIDKFSPLIHRIPFGLQLVPSGLMALGLLFVKESPRWLARRGRNEEALHNLAFLRRRHESDEEIIIEFAEIEASVKEEVEGGLSLFQAVRQKGTPIRFIIAFVLFVFQQWAGQNAVNYFGPQIFSSIGYQGTTPKLLATGIYGVVKVVATLIAVSFGIERLGRRLSLLGSAAGMGILFYIIGALLKTHPPDADATIPSSASKAMAGLIYIYCCAYSFGWGPVPWVVVAEIFNNRTRASGVAFASATQWLFNFSLSQATPRMVSNLGWKLFIVFATINIGGMVPFSYLLPETKGKTLEEMDVIFGTIDSSKRKRQVDDETRKIELALGSSQHPRLYSEEGYAASSSLDDKDKQAAQDKTHVNTMDA